jgi:uncharacterized protein
MREDNIKTINDFVANHSELDDIHGFIHSKRVFRLCMEIGTRLNADLDVLIIASLMHDIGRRYEDIESESHAEISADMALDFLKCNDFNLSKSEIDNIINCIRAHSYSNKIKPMSREAMILSDADKIDALGAIGLYRTIGYTIKMHGGLDKVIEHLEKKIMHLKDQLFLEESKKIAEKREKIIIDFYHELKEEIK